jgi:hypothetical protein
VFTQAGLVMRPSRSRLSKETVSSDFPRPPLGGVTPNLNWTTQTKTSHTPHWGRGVCDYAIVWIKTILRSVNLALHGHTYPNGRYGGDPSRTHPQHGFALHGALCGPGSADPDLFCTSMLSFTPPSVKSWKIACLSGSWFCWNAMTSRSRAVPTSRLGLV